MARPTLACMALAAILLAGCDAKPPKPETGGAAAAPAVRIDPGAAIPAERSLRLFGRGVNRQRQIRV